MIRYVASRIGQAALVLWGAFTVTYLILYLLPGDPLSIMLSASGIQPDSLSPQQLAQARAQYGLDQGLVARYFSLLGHYLQGNFGLSLTTNEPVRQLLVERAAPSLDLAAGAVVLSVLSGFGFAYAVALVTWPPLRQFLKRLPALGQSTPVFWTGLLFIQIFAFDLGWFPATGNDGLQSLVLPAVTLAIPSGATYAQVLLRSFDDVWKEPFIVTALAKGLSRRQVQGRHVLRNALLPVLTLVGLQIGNLVFDAVLVETVFARVGVGRLAQDAVLRQDMPVVLAIVTLSAAIFVVINLIVDLLYPVLDPRIARTPRVT
jgi:peptide/nickel transport system permease protein